MQIRKGFLFLLCSLFIISCSQPSDAALHDTEGRTIPRSELSGKWIILNYWASWCENCAQEIPELNNFYKHNQDKNISLYGVDFDPLPPATLKQAVNQMRITFPVLLENPSELWGLDEIEAIPVTFIISPAGKVVKKIVGGSTEQSLHEALAQLQSSAGSDD